MDYSAEKYFVNTFIRKARRDRILYELTTPAKRYEGIGRFCHETEELLNPQRILMQGEDLDRKKEFQEFVRQHEELCLILSPEFGIDEQFVSLGEAVKLAVMSLDAVLILGSSFAIVFGEPGKHGRGKYLLAES